MSEYLSKGPYEGPRKYGGEASMAEPNPKKESPDQKRAETDRKDRELREGRARQLEDYEKVVTSLEKQMHVAKTNSRRTVLGLCSCSSRRFSSYV
jgi:hypothetical protein